MALIGPTGRPLTSNHKKAKPPPLGEAFGVTYGDIEGNMLILPHGGALQFDFTKLRLSDYREMLNHYQMRASLQALSFLLHQASWTIECDDPKIAAHCEENLNQVWTPLSMAMSTAHWAGFSPVILQWENDVNGRAVRLAKIKDILPEAAEVNWKMVDGWAPSGHVKPKHRVYDGIREYGSAWPIPPESSLWYPFRMENGNYYGTKMLQSAYIPWYFSQLIHLYANRYFERFGEPAMLGRAPQGETVDFNEGGKSGELGSSDFMAHQVQKIRSGAVAILPNDKTGGSDSEYEYTLQYIESQMRGADFERYMTRLDDEMSLATFIPMLLLRTADVGSYNLGQTHMQMFLWSLNSLNADRKQYIDRFILSRMVDFNFSTKAPRARIKFRKMGNDNAEIIRTTVAAMLSGKLAEADLEELSAAAGLTLTELDPRKLQKIAEAQVQQAANAEDENGSNDPDPSGNPDNPDNGTGVQDRSEGGVDGTA